MNVQINAQQRQPVNDIDAASLALIEQIKREQEEEDAARLAARTQ